MADGVEITEPPQPPERGVKASTWNLLLATGMQGNISTETMRAFSEKEMADIIARLP